MSILNKVILVGNTGDVPVVRETKNGNKVVNIRMASNESYKNPKGETVVETHWHNLVGWGRWANYMEKIEKGSHLVVEGCLAYRSYKTEQGETRYTTEVKVIGVKNINSPAQKAA